MRHKLNISFINPQTGFLLFDEKNSYGTKEELIDEINEIKNILQNKETIMLEIKSGSEVILIPKKVLENSILRFELTEAK